jgi:hypothetical protein
MVTIVTPYNCKVTIVRLQFIFCFATITGLQLWGYNFDLSMPGYNCNPTNVGQGRILYSCNKANFNFKQMQQSLCMIHRAVSVVDVYFDFQKNHGGDAVRTWSRRFCVGADSRHPPASPHFQVLITSSLCGSYTKISRVQHAHCSTSYAHAVFIGEHACMRTHARASRDPHAQAIASTTYAHADTLLA